MVPVNDDQDLNLKKNKHELNIENKVRIIQKFYRTYIKPAVNKENLTLERFKPGKLFRHVSETLKIYRFEPEQLAEWFLKCGKFHNPYTREPFNIIELKRLMRMIYERDKSFGWNFACNKNQEIIRKQTSDITNLRETITLFENEVYTEVKRFHSFVDDLNRCSPDVLSSSRMERILQGFFLNMSEGIRNLRGIDLNAGFCIYHEIRANLGTILKTHVIHDSFKPFIQSTVELLQNYLQLSFSFSI